MNSPRITARIYREEDGETCKHHKLNDISFGSLDALEAALTAR
jgi:hypothetical protein